MQERDPNTSLVAGIWENNIRAGLESILTLIPTGYEYFIPYWLLARYVPNTDNSSARDLDFLG